MNNPGDSIVAGVFSLLQYLTTTELGSKRARHDLLVARCFLGSCDTTTIRPRLLNRLVSNSDLRLRMVCHDYVQSECH